jgi:hypothetical protein
MTHYRYDRRREKVNAYLHGDIVKPIFVLGPVIFFIFVGMVAVGAIVTRLGPLAGRLGGAIGKLPLHTTRQAINHQSF